MITNTIVEVKDVHKQFRVGKQFVQVVRGISLNILPGEFVVVFGPSGSGKSTLLHMMIGLENPTKGSLLFRGKDLYSLSEDERAEWRKTNLGMVYQQSNWIKALPVIDNVAFPLLLVGEDREHARDVALKKLALFGMDKWAEYYPTELSAGQQQRVALARALVSNPAFIVADEPTGNLDFESGQHLVTTLSELAQAGNSIVMVTHDLEHLGLATRGIQLRDGQIVKEYDRAGLRTIADEMSRHGISVVDAAGKKQEESSST